MDNTTPPGEQVIQAEPPPLMVTQQQAYSSHSNHGSVGPVIGVLAVIAVLGIIAGMIGRICSGRSIMGYGGRFDMEEWVETKCSSCIDGHVGPSPPRFRPEMVVPPLDHRGGGSSRVPVVGFPRMVNRGEIKTEDEEQGRQRESSSYEEQQKQEEQNHQQHGYYVNHQQEQQEQQQKQQEQHGYHGNHQQRHPHVEES